MKVTAGTIISETNGMVLYYGDPDDDPTVVVLHRINPRQCIVVMPSGAVKGMLHFVNVEQEHADNASASLALLQQDLVDSFSSLGNP